MVEQKMLELLLDPNHLLVIIGIFSVITILKKITPISMFIFGTDESPSKWKWLVTPINLALASIGIFGLGMTQAKDVGTKAVIVLLITAVTIMLYEAFLKYLVSFVEKKIFKKTG